MRAILKKTAKRAEIILKGEQFINAFRTTVTIVLPVFVLYILGYHITAIDVGLGTLLVGLTDVPGDIYEKVSSLFIGTMALTLMSFVTLTVLTNIPLLGLLVATCCFGFSMLFVYGGSPTAIGTMALIMMIFTMGLRPIHDHFFCVSILAGGIWYSISTIAYMYCFPYRPIKHAIYECIMEISAFLRIKAEFYSIDHPLTDTYKKAIRGHIRVCEKQDATRSILLKERMIFRTENEKTGQLIRVAAEVIDLYEQILAIHYDYGYVRDTLDNLNVLETIEQTIQEMADELYEVGLGIYSSTRQKPIDRLSLPVQQLRAAAVQTDGLRCKLINRIADNTEFIYGQISLINQLINEPGHYNTNISGHDALRFVNEQPVSVKRLAQQLTFRSPIFRFALRVSLTCLGAFIATLYLVPGKYNYWLLLTIIIVARPSFGGTRRRNFQRIVGTLIGIPAAFITLYFISQPSLQVALVIVFLMGYLAFLQINYLISVVFITIVAIIGLHLLGGNNNDLMLQRGFETMLGCAIALTATFLFPFWESRKLKGLIGDVLKANISYMEQLRNFLLQKPLDLVEYKLIRKQVFVSSANLSRAYEHILAEPNAGKADNQSLYRFQIFNHELYALVASMVLDETNTAPAHGSPNHIQNIDRSIAYLNDSLETIYNNVSFPAHELQPDITEPGEGAYHKLMLSEQLESILSLARNIRLEVNQMAFISLH